MLATEAESTLPPSPEPVPEQGADEEPDQTEEDRASTEAGGSTHDSGTDALCSPRSTVLSRSQAWKTFLELFTGDNDSVLLVHGHIKNFLTNVFEGREDVVTSQVRLHAFLDKCVVHICKIEGLPLDLSESHIRDGLEKFIMSKLYRSVFASDPKDLLRNEEFGKKLARLRPWIAPHHLDMPSIVPVDDPRFQKAQRQLVKMNQFKAPMDKVVCVLNCCQILNTIIASLSDCSSPSADIFLPCLIFALIRACPPDVVLNLQYVWKFSHPKQLDGHKAYLFTHFYSAVSFVENLDSESVGLTPDEFLQQMSTFHEPEPSEHEDHMDTLPEFEADPCADDHAQRLADYPAVPSFPFTFAERSPSDLLVADIPDLLREYKSMCSWIKEVELIQENEGRGKGSVWTRMFHF